MRLWVAAALCVLCGCGQSDFDEAETTPSEDVSVVLGDTVTPTLTVVFEPPARVDLRATDVAFNSSRPAELWALLRAPVSDEPCTEADDSGCTNLVGHTAIIDDVTSASPRAEIKTDANAWHFMRRPTSLDFGPDGLFATCHEARTGNYTDERTDYIGPTLWSSDPAIYTIEPPGKNGSHLDMLHETPFCMGIAHRAGNQYFTFNGQLGAIDLYDFKQPHEIGGADHTDGEIYRYVEGELERVPEVPSHLAFDDEAGLLYIADTAGGRVLRLDPDSGDQGAELDLNEFMHVGRRVDGATLESFVLPGVLSAPSGIAFFESIVLVTDNETSTVHAFDRTGAHLAALALALPPGSLSGLAVGPDERLYLADLLTGRVYRLDIP